jgi:hypothetical protein
MTQDIKDVLKLALEALENPNAGLVPHKGEWRSVQSIAITAIKEALAQPEQEPVAWLEPEWGEKICPEVGYEATMTDDHPRDLCWIPLYPHPPQRTWVGLTDEEANELWESTDSDWELMKRTESKLKEKNT